MELQSKNHIGEMPFCCVYADTLASHPPGVGLKNGDRRILQADEDGEDGEDFMGNPFNGMCML